MLLLAKGAAGKAMLTIMAAFDQLERDTMIERTPAGLAHCHRQRTRGWTPAQVR
jgi:DNA invertase Pin-like site-specific DNA recombinase